ncbi:hypothetical protein [Duganella vulcania]|uniref:Uncharacterized protein n=1 Tax=Duganella vulcania TaxID=2692166 RepID=A0A845GN08_9BURK|nr:hypothetical protein [Duganella vulcania]MYM94815.1 hypothetical protein [Duganella vulcania]
MQHLPEEQVQKPAVPDEQAVQLDIAAKLEARNKAIAAAFGILKGKDVFPEDGLEYQLEVRAEWD